MKTKLTIIMSSGNIEHMYSNTDADIEVIVKDYDDENYDDYLLTEDEEGEPYRKFEFQVNKDGCIRK